MFLLHAWLCEAAEKGGKIMFMRFSDDLKSEWDRRLLPLWCCFVDMRRAVFVLLPRGPVVEFFIWKRLRCWCADAGVGHSV